MRGILQFVWALPWPGRLRQLMGALAVKRGLRTFFVPQFMVGVVGLIEDEEGAVLLLRHTYRTDYAWGLPTGFLEHHEAPHAALEREIHEETGLDVRLTSLHEVRADDRRPLVEIVYRGSVVGGDFRASQEVDTMMWARAEALPPLRPDQLALLRRASAGRKERHESLT
jgi:ADP-ribose pyrophosphatase YjhB (NUDIX family)